MGDKRKIIDPVQSFNTVTPMAQPLNTKIEPHMNEVAPPNFSSARNMMDLAGQLGKFMDTAAGINKVLIAEGQEKAKEQYLKDIAENKDQWTQTVKKNPNFGLLNPWASVAYDKLALKDELTKSALDFSQDISNRYDLNSEQFLAKLNGFESQTYKALLAKGYKADQINEVITPLMSEFKQQQTAQYQSKSILYNDKLYKSKLAESTSSDLVNNYAQIVDPKVLPDALANTLQKSFDNLVTVKGVKPEDIAELSSGILQNMLGTIEEHPDLDTNAIFKAFAKVNIDGKPLNYYNSGFLKNMSDTISAFHTAQFNKTQLKLKEEAQRDNQFLETTYSNMYVDLANAMEKGQDTKGILKKYQDMLFKTNDMSLISATGDLFKTGLQFINYKTTGNETNSDSAVKEALWSKFFSNTLTTKDVLAARNKLSDTDFIQLGDHINDKIRNDFYMGLAQESRAKRNAGSGIMKGLAKLKTDLKGYGDYQIDAVVSNPLNFLTGDVIHNISKTAKAVSRMGLINASDPEQARKAVDVGVKHAQDMIKQQNSNTGNTKPQKQYIFGNSNKATQQQGNKGHKLLW